MTDQVVRCPSCGQANRVPEVGGGKRAVCGRCKTPLDAGAHDGHPIELTDADFAQKIASGPFVVDFWAPWCGPCRMIAPILEQLAAERHDVRFAKINVDDNPRTASQFGVQGIPLLVLFNDGKEAGRIVGAVPRSQIESAIRTYLGR